MIDVCVRVLKRFWSLTSTSTRLGLEEQVVSSEQLAQQLEEELVLRKRLRAARNRVTRCRNEFKELKRGK